jgi:hypothetical protein
MKRTPFMKLVNAITGFQTPVFGVTWTAPKKESETARGLLTFLEDQRVLTSPYDVLLNDLHYVADAIHGIRKRLTQDLESLDRASELANAVAAMRAVCRKCLDHLAREHAPSCYHGLDDPRAAIILLAIGELRGVFGIHIGRLCVAYGMDVEEDLGAIIPSPDNASEIERDENAERE